MKSILPWVNRFGLALGLLVLMMVAPAHAVTDVYDADADWNGFNIQGATWSYYTAANPVTISTNRANALMGTTTGHALPSPSFGNFDEGRVFCCSFTVTSSFSQGVYVRFTNPLAATMSLFYELVSVNPKPPDQQVYIFGQSNLIYQGGGPVTLDLGFQPAGAFFEFAIGSLGCCGDQFHVTLRYTAISAVPEAGSSAMLAGGLVMLGLLIGRRRVMHGLRNSIAPQ